MLEVYQKQQQPCVASNFEVVNQYKSWSKGCHPSAIRNYSYPNVIKHNNIIATTFLVITVITSQSIVTIILMLPMQLLCQ